MADRENSRMPLSAAPLPFSDLMLYYEVANLNASYRIPTRGRFKHVVGSGVHAVSQSQGDYVTTIATTSRSYTTPLYQEQLFKFNPYFSYKLSF